jgi:antitoxin VapB
MALNLKNPEVERLVEEVSRLTGESKTEAVRKALEERKERLAMHVVKPDRYEEAIRWLEAEVWSKIPPEHLGKRLTKEEEEEILGFGPDGV